MRSLFLLFGGALSVSLAFAAEPELIQSEPLFTKQAAKVYIVQLRDDPIAAYQGGVSGIAATKPVPGAKIEVYHDNVRHYFDHLTASHKRLLADVGATERVQLPLQLQRLCRAPDKGAARGAAK